ncbi:MAG TPA: hypothetical protein VGQ33_24030 [Vicinamibacteria bacterium]|nr:hypothetical protein [Vicinamibacteria bacterium]
MAAPLAWTAALLAASRSPWCLHLLPCLAVLQGPLAILLLALGLAAAVAPVLPRLRVPRVRPAVFLLLAWVFLAAVGLSYTLRLRVSGDEPHYLLMAQSLWREGDLDLSDNLAREDWREYTPGPIVPHFGAPRRDGRPFPAHSPGLPLLLAPLYGLGGRSLCVLALALMGAALAVEMGKAARRSTGNDEAALLAAALALVPPVAFYSFQIYTEVPAALALAVALRWLLAEAESVRPRLERAAGAALLAGTLPWLHLKMAPAAAALGLIALARLRGRARTAFVVVAASMAAAFLLYYRAIFGIASPLAIYGGLPKDADGSPLRAVAGLLFDRSFGLLPYAPVFLLALAGLGLLWRARAWEALLVGAAVLAPTIFWRMWWGGQCPPARFLVPLVPLLSLAAAARISASRTGLVRWRWGLAALGLAATLGMTLRPEALLLLNRGDRPTRLWTALSGERPAGFYLPSLVAAAPDDLRVAAVWLGALAILLALDVLARRRPRVDRLFRGLGLPLLLLLLVGAAVDGWARRTPPQTTTAASPGSEPD